MDLRFYKLRICDADLLLVDDIDGNGRERDWPKAAVALQRRRRGAGADRLAVLARAEADTWLRVFDPQGDEGPVADAALCAARYLLDSGRSGSELVRLRSSAGELEVDVLDSASLGLKLGPPRSLSSGEALSPAEAGAAATSIESEGGRYQVLPLRVGLPGSDGIAVFSDGGPSRLTARVGSSGKGPAPAPVIVRIFSRGELSSRIPKAGGFDACATAGLGMAAASAAGYADSEALVRLGDGALWIEWSAKGWLYAVGRPEYVYRGEFHLGDPESKLRNTEIGEFP
jgi:diaminopimelate epimerase